MDDTPGLTPPRASDYRVLFNAGNDAVFVLDPGDDRRPPHFVEANDTACLRTGYSRDQLRGMAPSVLHAPEYQARAADTLRRLRDESSVLWESVFVCRDGSRLPVEINSRAIEFRGRPHYLSSARDLTERRRAEKALRDSEARFRSLFDGISDAAFVLFVDEMVSPDVRYAEVNAAACRRYGYTREELLAIGPRAMVPPEQQAVLPERLATIQSSQVAVWESVHLTRDGRPIPVEMSSCLFTLGGRPALMGLARDISERREAQAQRDRLEAQVRQAQKLESLGVLAGGIAHDFNNLMAGLFGYIELARSAAVPGSETDECLGLALEVYGRARTLTQQLLTFAKGGEPQLTPTDLEPLVRRRVEPLLTASAITVRYDIDRGIWKCQADPDQIAQVIDAVVLNARQAMPAGGTLEVHARNRQLARGEHPALPEGHWVEVSFRDSGPGIPPDMQAKVFEPFFSTKPHGTGLGLATAYSVVRRHHGILELESPSDGGCTIRMILPAAALDPGALARDPARSALGGRVLVMDDEEALRTVLTRMLTRLGFEPITCRGADEARRELDKARKTGASFALLILDLTIPGEMGGRALLDELRREGVTVPALAVSGYSDDPVIADPASHGFASSLSKPFTFGRLREVVEQVVARG